MERFDVAALDPRAAYQLLVGAVIPRPIAWTTTRNLDGSVNLAPFSFFNACCAVPPMVTISVGRRADGDKKDTWRNAERERELVVHLVTAELGEVMNRTSAALPYGESEIAQVGLQPAASAHVAVPGFAEAALRMECAVDRILELGAAGGNGLIIARVLAFHVRPELIERRGERIALCSERLDVLGRMGGNLYCHTTAQLEMARPAGAGGG